MGRMLIGLLALAVRESNRDSADLVAISNGVIACSLCAGVSAMSSSL